MGCRDGAGVGHKLRETAVSGTQGCGGQDHRGCVWPGPSRIVGAGTSWVRDRTRGWFQGLVVIQVPTALSSGRIYGFAGAESWTQRSCFLRRDVWLMSSGTAEAASWLLALSMCRSTVRPGLGQGTQGRSSEHCATPLFSVATGGFGVDFSKATEDVGSGVALVARRLLSHGVTSFCPTLVTSPPEVYHKVRSGRSTPEQRGPQGSTISLT